MKENNDPKKAKEILKKGAAKYKAMAQNIDASIKCVETLGKEMVEKIMINEAGVARVVETLKYFKAAADGRAECLEAQIKKLK